MHDTSLACRADAALSKNSAAGVNGKSAQVSGRPLIVLKQTAVTSERSTVSDGFDTVAKAPIPSKETTHISSGLEMFKSPESNGISAPSRQYYEIRKHNVEGDILYGVKQSQLGQKREQGLQNASDNQGTFVRAANLKHQCEVDAPRERRGRGLSALLSDSHAVVKLGSDSSQSNGQDSSEPLRSDDSEDLEEWEPQSARFHGQLQVFPKHVVNPRVSYNAIGEKCKKQRISSEEQDASSSDLRNHLMKRRKSNSLPAVSEKLNISRGQTDMGISARGSQQQIEDHDVQQDRKMFAKADSDEVKGAKLNGREISLLLKRASLNRVSNTDELNGRENSVLWKSASLNKVSNTDKCLSLDNKRVFCGRIPKKETLNFTGPKSLAQIKAEKMAGRAATSEAVGKPNLSTVSAEAGEKVITTRKLAMHVEATHVDVSNGKLSNSPLSPIKKSIDDKQKTATPTPTEAEGSKPLSAPLKRKRELDSNNNVRGTMSGAELPVLDSWKELEDGEVGDESEGCEEESLPSSSCPSVSVKEDSQVISSSSREVLQIAGVEATSDGDLSEEELKSDAEMEDVAYGDADLNIDDNGEDDDDDDEDFAKKLGRFFALSSD